MPPLTDLLLYCSLLAAWAANIFFLLRFLLNWHRWETARAESWAALGGTAAFCLAVSSLLPARGGYDNNHDFLYLGQQFFTSRPSVMLMFKEAAPLFTDGLSDLLSGSSLSAVLWKNRLLPLLSLAVFFSGLRRLGAGVPASAAASAFLFLNFLTPLNASAFSTTSANMFIWLTSLLAIADAWAAPGPGPAGVSWIMSGLVLVAASRLEFLPANLLLLAAMAAAKARGRDRRFFSAGAMAAAAAWAVPAVIWGLRALRSGPAGQVGGTPEPLRNFFYQLGTVNFGVITGLTPGFGHWGRAVDSSIHAGPAALCSAFLLLCAAGASAGALAEPRAARRWAAALLLLSVWSAYFSFIFLPMDLYPLHFMRHQLYFLVPFACLFALAAEGFARLAGPRRPAAVWGACLSFCLLYAVANARAALSFNRELRTNDIELSFLMEAQAAWPADAYAVFPARTRLNSRHGLLLKYFPAPPDCPDGQPRRLLKYVSPEPLVIRDRRASPLTQPPLEPGPPGSAWRNIKFAHRFYTAYSGSVRETEDPLPVTAGFYEMSGEGRDLAYLSALSGLCAMERGDLAAAEAAFRAATAAEPACLNCRYFLGVALGARGRRGQALREFEKVVKGTPGGLTPGLLELAGAAAAGDLQLAALAARSLYEEDQDLFLRRPLHLGLAAAAAVP